jgi:hypothetical protein
MTIDCTQKVATKSRKNDVNLKEKDIELLLLFKKTLENLSKAEGKDRNGQ